MLRLRHPTPAEWLDVVEADLVAFLQDHAANERRVSRSALTLAVQHPEKEALVDTLVDVSLEELTHFKQVYDLLRERGASLAQDSPDPYMKRLHKARATADRERWLLERLVLSAVVEARGYERFAMLGGALTDRRLREIYRALAQAEARHQGLYLRLARQYFPSAEVDATLDEVLDLEAEIARSLPLAPSLH